MDFGKAIWSVDVSKAEVRPKTPIAPGKYLKLTGVKTGKRTFQALSIQGWEKRYRKRAQPSQKITPTKNDADTKVI